MCPLLRSQSGLPAPLTGNASRPTFSGESASKNILTTTLRVSTTVDDNAMNDNSNKITDSISRFDPTFAWNLSRRRWSLDTEYTPGFSYSIELPRYRTVSHALQNSLSIMLAQHLNLRLRNGFTRTSDPFDRVSQAQTVPGFGVLDGTNPSLFSRPTLSTSDQAGLDITYAPAAHTTVGLSGTYATTMYEDLVPGEIFNRDTQVASGRAFIDQKLSPRQSVSASYNYQVITSGVYGRTVTQTVLLFDSWQLNPKVSFSVFGGPQYTNVHYGSVLATVPLTTGWSWSAGGTVDWKGTMTALSGSVSRRVSDGGGLGGAVQMTDFSGKVSRRIGKNWRTNFFASYTRNGSNGSSPLGRSINYFSGGVGVTRQIVRNLSFDARYWYSHEDQTTTVVPLGFLADHNRISIGLSYSFTHRLGS